MTPDRGGGVHRKDFTPQKATAAFRDASCRPVDLFLSGKLREAENGVTATGKEAAALEAELGAEVRAGEDVASLGTPLPSSEGLPASGSTPSMKARPGRPVPAQDEEQEAMEADSGGAAAEADGVDMGTVAVGGGGGLHAGRSLSDPAVGPTCPALAPAAGAPDPDPALAQFHQ